MAGRMAGNILEEVAQGYKYPVQKLYYENVSYPTTITKIEQYDKRGTLRATTEFKLVSVEDVTVRNYVPGSEGSVAEIHFYEYDHFGVLIK